jgi:hypothetical protein
VADVQWDISGLAPRFIGPDIGTVTFQQGVAITPIDFNQRWQSDEEVVTVTQLTHSFFESFGLTYSAGVLSGTPTGSTSQAGSVFQLRGTGNTSGLFDDSDFGTLIIFSPIAPILLGFISSESYVVDQPVAAKNCNVFSGATSFSIVPMLPTGLTFDTVTGTINGTPTVRGNFGPFTVFGTNATGSTAALPFTIAVVRLSSDETDWSLPIGLVTHSFKWTPNVSGTVSGANPAGT